MTVFRDRVPNLDFDPVLKNLVGIEEKDPIIPEVERVERPLPLLRPSPLVVKLENRRACVFCDLDRVVLASRIDNDDLISPARQRFKAAWKIVASFLVGIKTDSGTGFPFMNNLVRCATSGIWVFPSF